jgi:hypothetical protein
MRNLLVAAALVPAAYFTTATIPPGQTPLVAPGDALGGTPNADLSVWSETGLGPSPNQGQPYGAGTPGAPNYPFIEAPSMDYTTYGSAGYSKNLNLQAFEQQANIVNQQLYMQWVAKGADGPLPQYIGVDERNFDQWWAQVSANLGQDAPPQDFWTGLDPHNSFTSWIGTDASSDRYAAALPPSGSSVTSIGLPSPTMSPVTTLGGATYVTSASAGSTPDSVKQAIQDARNILAEDASFVKDPQLQAETAKVLAELAAAQAQQQE